MVFYFQRTRKVIMREALRRLLLYNTTLNGRMNVKFFFIVMELLLLQTILDKSSTKEGVNKRNLG